MIIRFILTIILVGLSGIVAASPVDKPWDAKELERRLTAELTQNGTLELPFPDGSFIAELDVAPCWETEPRRPDAIRFENGRITVAPSVDDAWLRIRAIRYYFGKDEPDYRVRLDGSFPSNAPPRLKASVCDKGCADQPIDLTQTSNGVWEGTFIAPKAGSFVENFILDVKGPLSVEGLSVSRPDTFNADEVRERDIHSMRMCVVPDNKMKGDVTVSGVGLIIFTNLVFVGALATLMVYRAFFPMFILGSFYLSNVFGIIFLYFGLSEPRLVQEATSRDILVIMAMVDVILLMTAAIGYGIVYAMSQALREKPLLPVAVDMRLAWVLFGALNCFFLVTQIGNTIAYFDAYAIDAGHASFVRNAISADTMGLKSHYFSLLFEHVPILLSFVILIDCLRTRRFPVAFAVVVIQALMMLYNGEKAPFVWYLYACAFVMVSVFAVRSRYLLGVMAACVAVVLAGILFGPERIFMMVDRALFGGLTATYRVFTAFPEKHPFLDGASIHFFGLGTGEPFRLELFMWRQIFPELYFSDISGTAAGSFWTQIYANFGLYPALLSGAVIGAVVAFYREVARHLFANVVFVALGGWLVFNFAGLGESNFTRFIADFYVVGVFVFVMLLLLVSTILARLGKAQA